ncbi:MAG: hypothetical protein IKQ29_01385 [Bacilli bacterium]|nr:hypothetical protein [Bacilli bacterium]
MAEKLVTDNDTLVSAIKVDLMMCHSYLTSASSFLKTAYGPIDYSDLFKDRIDKVRKDVNDMKSTVETNSQTLKNNSHYKDYDEVEGTWRYYG